MSIKECSHHDDEDRRQLLHRILAAIASLIILILVTIFLIWIILKPTKPRFTIQDATIYTFNISSPISSPFPTPNTLTLTMQVTLSIHNPNNRIGIYYQKLHVYGSYKNQQISLPTVIPDTYQGHKDFTVWSPFIYGVGVPVSPSRLSALVQDENNGMVLVNVKVNGRVKWKVGSWISGRYHIFVNCPAYVRFAGDRNNGIGVVAPAVKFQLLQSCSVDV
ncbi:NDR1/HIN1-like protein 1 [Cicer arietinum]|uniref:NDR1/HIN1-like protein 1 n=1 Tax=Cicer arietinum TaxID=3827 RepID=A0A1S2YKN3_CICAR|nr:NDR1/HIN1-like protein 1 [Cicer arietinum]